MSDKWISWFEELGQDCNDQVGKKCANLGEMTRMGLRVPPGFALSLQAYKDFMSLTGAAEEIKAYLDKAPYDFQSIQHFNEASAKLREIVESKQMPPEMREVTLRHYKSMDWTLGKLADIIVLDRNIFEVPITSVHDTKVLITMVGGEVVHRSY